MADAYEEIHPTPIASTSKAQSKRAKPSTVPALDGEHGMDLDEELDEQAEDDLGDADDDDYDPDDPIVRRLPVYYTPHYLQSLALLQYPDRQPQPDSVHPLLPPALRPDWPNDTSRAVGKLVAQYKPETQHLEVTIPMETHRDRWNEEHAKKYAEGVIEEKDKEREREKEKKGGRRKRRDAVDDEDELRYKEEKESRRLDKMVYASSGVPDVTSYLVGVVRNDALHLNPVNHTFQLRPSLTYLDNLLAIERRAKRNAQADDEDEDEEISDTEMKKEAAKAVQVSVKQQEAGTAAKGPLSGGNGRADAGLFGPMRAEEAEAWKPLTHYHANTKLASDAFDRMFAPTDQELVGTTSARDYLKA
ncbi:hypothetical protein JCM10908_001690 [Rhodotorula pacifica]|uniref:uncharacterized protein n=1 Tax=Rhodotorula pacifica TaxID=1495444 RepID=UPI00317D40D0